MVIYYVESVLENTKESWIPGGRKYTAIRCIMEFNNVLTISIAVVLCMTLYVIKVTDSNDPAEVAAQENIEKVLLQKIKTEQEHITARLRIEEKEKTKREKRNISEMRALVDQGVSPFAARCMVVGVGNSTQQKRCLKAGMKPVKKK